MYIKSLQAKKSYTICKMMHLCMRGLDNKTIMWICVRTISFVSVCVSVCACVCVYKG